MHSFEVHWNESVCRKKVRLGLEQVIWDQVWAKGGHGDRNIVPTRSEGDYETKSTPPHTREVIGVQWNLFLFQKRMGWSFDSTTEYLHLFGRYPGCGLLASGLL